MTLSNSRRSVEDSSIEEGFKKVKILSVNKIDPSFQNIKNLFEYACKKVKDGFQNKKYGFDPPKHLSQHFLPAEALAFD